MARAAMVAWLSAAAATAAAQYRSEVWSPDNGDGTYTNPVINADYSDPDVVAVGADYYLTASSFNCMPGLPILHSRDLVNWEIIGHALRSQFPDSVATQHGMGVYAPSIRHHDGYFYIYWGDPDRGVFMVRAADSAGPWSDPLMVIEGKGYIDTTPLWDDDGRCYLVNGWANSRIGFNGVLTVRELSADGTRPIGDPCIVFDGDATRNVTTEGPKFYKRDGWYWILCPAGAWPGAGSWPCAAARPTALTSGGECCSGAPRPSTARTRAGGCSRSTAKTGLCTSKTRAPTGAFATCSPSTGAAAGP